ncbi:MAG: hypothetical protein GY953_52425 [bacterium]|nr:hypothetical protein [bacterium]
MSPIEKVAAELRGYDHVLMNFGARESQRGEVELLITLKPDISSAHTYVAPIHPRDIGHRQFPWTFQRYLYDCLHDYVVELFVRTPQSREEHS